MADDYNSLRAGQREPEPFDYPPDYDRTLKLRGFIAALLLFVLLHYVYGIQGEAPGIIAVCFFVGWCIRADKINH